MSKINSNIKDDFQVVLLLSCFVGHPDGYRGPEGEFNSIIKNVQDGQTYNILLCY